MWVQSPLASTPRLPTWRKDVRGALDTLNLARRDLLQVPLRGRAVSTAAVTAIGCDESGWRQVLGVSVVDTESHDSWLGFLQAPRDRGTSGTEFVRIRCPRGPGQGHRRGLPGGRPSSDARLHARGRLLAAEAPSGPASSLRSSAPGTPPPPWPCTTRRARCWWGAA